MVDKEFCISRLTSLVTLMMNAKNFGDCAHFFAKAEGFIDGLFWGNVISTQEYEKRSKTLLDAFLSKVDEGFSK